VDHRSHDFTKVFRKLIDVIQDEDRLRGSSCLHPIQEQNRQVLLSLVRALGGETFGDAVRTHVENFLDSEPAIC
jgi:hypothetical protein